MEDHLVLLVRKNHLKTTQKYSLGEEGEDLILSFLNIEVVG